jgi:hypothetical protein
MCKCIEEVEKKLREVTGDPEVVVKTSFSFGANGITREYIPIAVTYRQKKKGGTFGRPLQGRIFGGYCPICGKELVEGIKKDQATAQKEAFKQ